MSNKRRTWKYRISIILFAIIIMGVVWLIDLIWFRPFNIRHFYEKAFVKLVLQSPEIITKLGIPVLYDWTKYKLDDESDARLWKNFRSSKEDYATLLSYDFDKQTPSNQLNTKILLRYLKNKIVDREAFLYHNYPINQFDGLQVSLPELLTNKHQLKSKSDIRAYISRLEGFETKFDQVLEGLKIREQKGIIPPRFVISRVLDEMKNFIGKGVENNILYTSFNDKIAAIEGLSAIEKEGYSGQVAHCIQNSVFKAYQKLISYHEMLYAKATNDDGVWKLPDGDAYYRFLLKLHTSTDLSPDEVFQMGIKEMERIGKEMRTILISEGYSDTTAQIGTIFQGISKEERFLFPENDSGKAMVMEEYQRIVDEAEKSLESAFDISQKASLTVEKVPEFQEAGAPMGQCIPASMDGSKGGVFLINLRKVSEHPKYGMKTLAYHEGIPGHHFQMSIAMELEDLPTFRTVPLFNAYLEGWALYSEQLAYELGFYKNDPFGNLGRLQSEMFRACRLVVDAGIHSKKWTREKAIKYMLDNTGLNESEVITEVERYIVNPGQACSYKTGMIKILELREKAKQVLGDKFDLRDFHRLVLKDGGVPLDILEENVEAYIKARANTL